MSKEFFFSLKNVPDFDRSLLISAQNLLTSSLFLNFLDVFLKILMNMSIFVKIYQNRIFLSGRIRVVQICTTQDGGFRRPPLPKIGLTGKDTDFAQFASIVALIEL